MMNAHIKILILLFFISACNSNKDVGKNVPDKSTEKVETPTDFPIKQTLTGADRMDEYVETLQGRKVALLVNQTSLINELHLADTLSTLGIDIVKIFAPEHGFRGEADAGEQVKDGKDAKTGIPLISLYGRNKKPSSTDLAGIDIIVFDIQDVGARFYTYISTMSYVMEACAENDVDFMVLDRPNPNGHYVDGPVLQSGFESFIGLHKVPVVHGMTVGEYAQMVNEEGWLENEVKVDLQIVKCLNYDHNTAYTLPVRPSPNLPNMRSIYLYPSLCFFEGTTANVGRGTDKQFQVYGHPNYQGGDYTYTPQSLPGAKNPKFKGEKCYGYDLTNLDTESIRTQGKLNLNYLINYYKTFSKGETFFLENNFFDKLAGTDQLKSQILSGMDAEAIRNTWKKDLAAFKIIRKKYLLYEE